MISIKSKNMCFFLFQQKKTSQIMSNVAGPSTSAPTRNQAPPKMPYIPEGPYRYKCSICPSSFSENYLLKSHMNVHIFQKFRCESCSLNCLTQERYEKHMLSKKHISKVNIAATQGNSKSDPRPLGCADCKKDFALRVIWPSIYGHKLT